MQATRRPNRKTLFKTYCNNKTVLVGSESSAASSHGVDVLVRDLNSSDPDSSETDSKQPAATSSCLSRPHRRLVTLKLRRVPVTNKRSVLNLKKTAGIVSEHSFFSKKSAKAERHPSEPRPPNEGPSLRRLSQRRVKVLSFDSARDARGEDDFEKKPASLVSGTPALRGELTANLPVLIQKISEERPTQLPYRRSQWYNSPTSSNPTTDTGSVDVLPTERRSCLKASVAAPDGVGAHQRQQFSRPDREAIQKAMAQRSNHQFHEDPPDKRRSVLEGGGGHRGDSSVSRTSLDHRVFPFHPTPSGHLKVKTNQVVYESRNLSVLVADPGLTTVNVKADLDKSRRQTEGEMDSSSQQRVATPAPASAPVREEIIYFNDVMTDDYRDSDAKPESEPELYLNRKGFSRQAPIDWKTLNLPSKSDLYAQLQYRIHNYIKPDCVVQIGNEEYCCHGIVLQCYSKFFDDLELVGNKNKIEVPEGEVSRRAFAVLYDWMVVSETESCQLLRRDNILEIFRAAQYLQIGELQQQCWAFLDNDEMFAEDTAFLMYLQAKKIGHTDVMQIMVPRIMSFFLCLVSSRDYIELSVDELCMILRSNYISVHCEMEVFMAAVRWLMFEWPSRQKYVEEVMSCIRFGHISPWTLVDIRRNPRNPPFLEVTNFKEVHVMIDDGLAFAIVKYWYANCPKDYAHWISILGITEPIDRNWIGTTINYVSYDEFLMDLNYYRRVYLNDLKRSKNGKPSTGKYYQLPALPPKESPFPHEQGMPLGPATSPSEAPPPDLANILEQRKARVKLEQSPPGTPNRNKVPVTPIIEQKALVGDNSIESDLFVVNFTHKSYPYELAQISNESPISQIEPKSVREDPRKHSLAKTKAVPSQQTSAQLSQGTNNMGFTPLPERQQQLEKKVSHPSQMKHPLTVIPTSISQYENQSSPVRPMTPATNSPLGKQRQMEPDESEGRTKYESHSHKSSQKSELINPSKPQKYWKENMNQSVLGPPIKNYLTENSLFFQDREAVLVLGGIDPHSPYGAGRNTGKDVFRFQPESNSWELIGDLPEPRQHHSVAFLKGRVFLAGGADPRDDDVRGKSVVVSTVWSFEPVSRGWFSETGMLTPRKNFGLVVSNGKLYAIGGQDRQKRVLSSVECYDPNTRNWQEVAPTQIPRAGMACAKFRDMIWVAGGMTDSLETPLTPTVEVYDTRRNVWSFSTPLRFPRCFTHLFAMNNVLYLIGGAGRISQKAHSTASIADIDVWDNTSKTWKLKAELVIPRHGHSLSYLGSQILIIGGVTTAYMRALNNVECYCCKRDTWIRGVNPLPITLSGHGSITLPPASLL